MAKAEKTVQELVNAIERGELLLPELQREYVWKGPRVRDLLDSLYRDYPSGVILTWQTAEEVDLADFAVETEVSKTKNPLLLLDGQQRLTSLSAVIRGLPIQVKDQKKPLEVLFNLDHPDKLTFPSEIHDIEDEEDYFEIEAPDAAESEMDFHKRMANRAFVLHHKKLAAMPNWVSVTEIFKSNGDAEILKGAGITSFDDPRFELYSSRIQKVRAIKDYVYRMDILEDTMSYDEVTEIFVRVNSQGAKLRGSDLALAQITAKWRGSLAMFKEYEAHCNQLGFNFDTGILVKALVSFATGQSLFKTVGSISLERLKTSWERARKGLDFAFNFVRSNAGITHYSLLSSPFLVITIAYWADKRGYSISQEDSHQMRKWLLLANAKGRYSQGSSESLLNQDLAILRNGGNHIELLERLRQQVGRLDFEPSELVGRTSRSGIFRTMFLAFSNDDAKDWWTALQISPTHTGKPNSIQFHHIFPKKFLTSSLPDLPSSQIDDIANLAFISANTNQRISDDDPRDYLEPIAAANSVALEKQQVPLDSDLWLAENYPAFLDARRKLIANRLNEFVQ
jgi:hypothetical protein